MLAYTDSLKPAFSRFVLSPDSDFFRYFRNPAAQGHRAEASAPAAPSAAPAQPAPAPAAPSTPAQPAPAQ
jgi:membrane protease subunit HflC